MATTSSSNGKCRLWTRVVVAACLLGLAGCVSMTEPECRSANWYDYGWRDALGGLRPMYEVYAYQCDALKVKASEGDYMKGWYEGKWEYDHRMHSSDCCGP